MTAAERQNVASEGRSPTSRPRRRPGGRLLVAGLTAVAALAVLLIGGGPAWARFVSALASFVVFAVWALLRRPLSGVPFGAAALVGLVFTAIQALPLPAGLVRLMSPRAFELRSSQASQAPAFMPLTLDRPSTIIALVGLLGAFATYAMAANLSEAQHRARRVLHALALIGVGLAVLAFVQRALGTTEVLGLYKVRNQPGGGFFGTFINANHAASLFTLSALISCGLALDEESPMRLFWGLSAVALSVATFATGSRAGVVALGLAVAALAFLVSRRRLGTLPAAAVALGGLLCFGAIGLTASSAGTRLKTGIEQGLLQNQKARGWEAALRLSRDFFFTGVGRGAFEGPATAYRLDSEGVRLVYPENVVLQLASEWGWVVTSCLFVLLVKPAWRLISKLRTARLSIQAAGLGVAAVVAHDMADFGLELSGIALPTALALGVVVGASGASRGARRVETSGKGVAQRWLLAGGAAWAFALILAGWAVQHTSTADGDRLRLDVASRRVGVDTALAAAVIRHPADYYLELLWASHLAANKDPLTLAHLSRAQRLYPADGTAHRQTARWLARIGRPTQAALEYRLAATLGLETSTAELLRAVGPDRLGEAVPQNSDRLFEAAELLVSVKKFEEAADLGARAGEMANWSDSALLRNFDLTVSTHNLAFIDAAAGQVAKAGQGPSLFVHTLEVLRGLSGSQLPVVADVMRRALYVHGHNGKVLYACARASLAAGDRRAAKRLLLEADENLTLDERAEVQTVLGDIAQAEGDYVSAANAHANARVFKARAEAGRSPPR